MQNTATFVWVTWNGRLHPEVRPAGYPSKFGEVSPIATFPLTEKAARLPLATLVEMFPPPALSEDAA